MRAIIVIVFFRAHINDDYGDEIIDFHMDVLGQKLFCLFPCGSVFRIRQEFLNSVFENWYGRFTSYFRFWVNLKTCLFILFINNFLFLSN